MAGASTIINFDFDAGGNVIPANTSITNQYAAWGVNFLGLENGNPINVNAAANPDGGPVLSSPNAMTNCSNANLTCPGNRADIVRITFDNPVSFEDVGVDSLGGGTITFELYDAANWLITSVSSTSNSYDLLMANVANVSRIDVLQPTDSWAYSFDNLRFSAQDVPEPASLALLGAGLLGMFAARRRS